MKIIKLIALFVCLSGGYGYSQTVQIPNVFTPDGDGVNDRFHIKTTGYVDLTCQIFNRHGEVVYRFHGLDGSWDGYSHAGVKVANGVYFVYLQLTTEGDIDSQTWQGTLQVLYR